MLSSAAKTGCRFLRGNAAVSSVRKQRLQPRGAARQHQQRRSMGSDMPVPQSMKAELWEGHTVKNEGWESYMYFYYAVGLFMQAAVVAGAPETRIESWAREEAKARLYLASEAGGGRTEPFEFGKHYQDEVTEQRRELWTKFNEKSINPGDDDDDDDDEDDDEDEDDEDDEEDDE